MRGIPDIILVKQGQFIGLEVKTKIGRQPGDRQQFQYEVTRAGANITWSDRLLAFKIFPIE